MCSGIGRVQFLHGYLVMATPLKLVTLAQPH